VSQTRHRRTKSTGREGVRGAFAIGKLCSTHAALALHPSNKILPSAAPFQRVALHAARDEVAVRIILDLHTRHDMIQAAHKARQRLLAIETTPTFTRMDGPAQPPVFPEVQPLQVVHATRAWRMARYSPNTGGPNLLGNAHLDQVARIPALHHPQRLMPLETAG